MPVHTHALHASTANATTVTPSPDVTFASVPVNATLYSHSATPTTLEAAGSMISSEGGGAAHDNVMPSMGLSYIICLNGTVYPIFESDLGGGDL